MERERERESEPEGPEGSFAEPAFTGSAREPDGERTASATSSNVPPPRGNRRGVALVVVVAVIAGVAYLYSRPGHADRADLRGPAGHLDVSWQETLLLAEEGGRIRAGEDLTIIVPPNALVDRDGRAITGKVIFRHREFKDHVDFFRAGVPMEFEEEGGVLESAGMVEILASQGDRELELKPDTSLTISFPVGRRLGGTGEGLFALSSALDWRRVPDARVEPTNPVAQQVTRRDLDRVFSASGFGVWNCDAVRGLESANQKTVRPVDEQGNALVIPKLMLAMRGVNSLLQCGAPTANGTLVNYGADEVNMLYGVTADDRLAVFPPEEFSKMDPDPLVPASIGMTTTPLRSIPTAKELRAHLRLD